MALDQIVERHEPSPLDESDALAGCQAGDPAAFRALYEQYVQSVLRTARRLGVPSAEAEDVTQEVFAVAFREVHKVVPGSVWPWLFRLTSNRANDWHRRRRVRDTFAHIFRSSDENRARSDPERELIVQDSEARVARILGQMSRKKREVFVLYEIEGLQGTEIARQVGVPVPTVWSRLNHARAEFVRIGKKLDVLDEARRAKVHHER